MDGDRDGNLADDVRAVRLGSAGWHIQRLAVSLDRAIQAELTPHGMTQRGFALLMMVFENEGMAQNDIGARFNAPPYAITRALDALEAEGFVRRREDDRSKRTKRVYSTAKAQALIPSFFAAIKVMNDRLLAPLDGEERGTALALLKVLVASNALNKP
ncbi:MAG: MarR family transcriptional regulator [Pseudomonadota bacterium]